MTWQDEAWWAAMMAAGAARGPRAFGLDVFQNQPRNIWSDGTSMWVGDRIGDGAYVYRLATGKRTGFLAFDRQNDEPYGMWSDGTTLWVADVADDVVYAYTLSTGARRSDQDFRLDPGNGTPVGMWSDGTTAWIVDQGRRRMYAYTLATGARVVDREFDLEPSADFATGCWSDGTTLWVANWSANVIEAYSLSTGVRVPVSDLRGDPASPNPIGIWSDGEVMWVLGGRFHRVQPYGLPAGRGGEYRETTPVVVDTLASLEAQFADVQRGNNGRWEESATGSSTSVDTGPSTNNRLGFTHTEMSGARTQRVAEREESGRIVFRSIQAGTDRTLRLRLCLQGTAFGNADGLRVQTLISGAWTTQRTIPTWPWASTRNAGSEVTARDGSRITFSVDGGWVDFDVAIPDDATSVRLFPDYETSSTQQDIAFRQFSWVYRS